VIKLCNTFVWQISVHWWTLKHTPGTKVVVHVFEIMHQIEYKVYRLASGRIYNVCLKHTSTKQINKKLPVCRSIIDRDGYNV